MYPNTVIKYFMLIFLIITYALTQYFHLKEAKMTILLLSLPV